MLLLYMLPGPDAKDLYTRSAKSKIAITTSHAYAASNNNL